MLVTKPLVKHILHQTTDISSVFAEQSEAFAATKQSKNVRLSQLSSEIKCEASAHMERSILLSEEKGASSWVTALPLVDFGFALSKSDFHDALHLQYGWRPARLPSSCVCGKDFSVDHSLTCSHGGYLGLRHNEVRDLLGKLLDDTCHDVCIEPQLQPLSGEHLHSSTNSSMEARLDLKASGFWSSDRHRAAFFDVRVFHPHARSYRNTPVPALYKIHEREKRRHYEDRVREVDRGTFTPLVFSSTGGAGPAAKAFIKRLANMLAAKKETDYATTIDWLRCRLSFSLLRSSILCLRGSRSLRRTLEIEQHQPDVALAEGRVNVH